LGGRVRISWQLAMVVVGYLEAKIGPLSLFFVFSGLEMKDAISTKLCIL